MTSALTVMRFRVALAKKICSSRPRSHALVRTEVHGLRWHQRFGEGLRLAPTVRT
jgi:hypothetical protein